MVNRLVEKKLHMYSVLTILYFVVIYYVYSVVFWSIVICVEIILWNSDAA